MRQMKRCRKNGYKSVKNTSIRNIRCNSIKNETKEGQNEKTNQKVLQLRYQTDLKRHLFGFSSYLMEFISCLFSFLFGHLQTYLDNSPYFMIYLRLRMFYSFLMIFIADDFAVVLLAWEKLRSFALSRKLIYFFIAFSHLSCSLIS